MKSFVIIALLTLLTLQGAAQTQISGIRQTVNNITSGKQAVVGVAVLSDDGELVVINDEVHYPVMSVFKFHVAVAALKKMERENVSLDSIVVFRRSQMHKNTYSPMLFKYPEGDINISYGDLIRYSVSESDNNACDLLIEYAGGINEVDGFVKSLSIDGFGFSETEYTMHLNMTNCYNNWSTPSSMVRLLKKVYTEEILMADHFDFLERTMIETTTGQNKMKAGLPVNIVLGHKTGSSDRTTDGTKAGDNDAGIIYLPDGRKCYIAVFIKDSQETDTVNAEIIAGVTKAVYNALVK